MSKITLRYVGREHTIVKFDGEEIKVEEGETIDIPVEKKDWLLNNHFKLVEDKNIRKTEETQTNEIEDNIQETNDEIKEELVEIESVKEEKKQPKK